MSWNREKHERVLCPTCGWRIARCQVARHLTSRWHQLAPRIRELRVLGLSHAEIGRQLGLTRAYVAKKLEDHRSSK